MEELCEKICHEFEADKFDVRIILEKLKEIKMALGSVSSRFVDIDSTVKEDESLKLKVLGHLSDFPESASLFKIYEAMKTYLLIKNKYGEAADWYLKNEFELNYVTFI